MKKRYTQQTKMFNKGDLPLQWFLLDAKGKVLGRLASEIAKILMGKHKPTYTPHADTGDGVVIINADQVEVTGMKEAQKVYRYYTGHIGGLREVSYRDMKKRKPHYILEHAVKKMLPKNRLGRAQMKKLRIFCGEEHSMEAQKPIKANI
jgi:large subunit ribosomal protein L13